MSHVKPKGDGGERKYLFCVFAWRETSRSCENRTPLLLLFIAFTLKKNKKEKECGTAMDDDAGSLAIRYERHALYVDKRPS